MEIKFTDEASEDLETLSEAEKEEVKTKLREISSQLSHRDLKLVENPLLIHPVWELTVDTNEADHRVFIDVKRGKIVVLGVFGFDFSHSGSKHWKELQKRL